jgi:catechol-2,3-dioxygenase
MRNKVAKLDHLNFTVSNFDKATAWYKEIFHFELVEEGKSPEGVRWGILRSGDSMLAISEYPNKKEYRGVDDHVMNHFGLKLTDRKAWEKPMEEFELKAYYPSPVEYPNSTSWYVQDPSGNKIEVAIWHNDRVRF